MAGKEIDKQRANAALAVIRQHPGMALFLAARSWLSSERCGGSPASDGHWFSRWSSSLQAEPRSSCAAADAVRLEAPTWISIGRRRRC
ncbi:hypothetical protein I540_1364 [Mycobacteroides abscessus subsp. bolletii 1513]|uniref:Uncharacterized protein n=1 Tax=Mycobacteroides abscessus subsp. bolletii 1513 TaxID=1299321 RepID=X8DTJ5_9MYCO|nr:hypothetical protein I540_1364 [Mycobacteroides abscessus subsp. bolletii 1513]